MAFAAGRHFLQIPGPTNVPDRILRAIDRPTIDHRGPDFARMTRTLLADLADLFGTRAPVIVYPSSGTGAWEAALVNTLSPGERVLMAETGQFAILWSNLARRLGLEVDLLPGDWRHPADLDGIEARLAEDRARTIKAVAVVHNETSTGTTSDVAAVRRILDRTGHPALLMVDTISSLASIDYRHDEWGVDVAVGGSQKGLMLPPGLSFNALSDKALAASRTARLPRSYWDWEGVTVANRDGSFPYTPATNLLYGLAEALAMLREEGMAQVFARHARLAAATRAAVRGWGLELQCLEPEACSDTVTAIRLPDGSDADALRAAILDRWNVSLGAGLGKVKGRVFRIGHLGSLNEPMLMGALCAVEMGLAEFGPAPRRSGVATAMECLRAPAERLAAQ